jgi:hypothetical protein
MLYHYTVIVESPAGGPNPAKSLILSFARGLADFAPRHAGFPEHVVVATAERIPCRFREATALFAGIQTANPVNER